MFNRLRPRLTFANVVSCGDNGAIIYGPGSQPFPQYDGAVSVAGEFVYLEAISFRAES